MEESLPDFTRLLDVYYVLADLGDIYQFCFDVLIRIPLVFTCSVQHPKRLLLMHNIYTTESMLGTQNDTIYGNFKVAMNCTNNTV